MGLSNLRKRPDRWSASVWRLLSGEKRLRHPHHIRTPDKYRRSLVQSLGLDIEESILAVGCQTAGLLENKGERIGLVHQAELEIGRASCRERADVSVGRIGARREEKEREQ